jgi:tRNA threonylcarbamoyladenosine biosynthesis protein TsaE
MNVITHEPSETREVARALAGALEPGDVILVAGELGAGKTEFAKGVADGLDITETVVSPTFTLAREYHGRLRMLHVDLYRAASIHEVLDLGLEDLAGSDADGTAAVLVVEWGDIAASVFPADHLLVHIEAADLDHENERRLRFECFGGTWAAREGVLGAVMPDRLVSP